MIEVIGWLALALGGAYLSGVFSGSLYLFLRQGGIETVLEALWVFAIAAAVTAGTVLYLSPLSVGWGA